ncbi:MAG: dihydrodipicolinate synthase family protein [Burkholderiaceae bacterium]
MAMSNLLLPDEKGLLAPFRFSGRPVSGGGDPAQWNRVAYAAAHVVADPLSLSDPWLAPAIDWERTIAYREHLWTLGFGVAEAMDTAQRGMGLDWDNSLDLVRRSLAAARAFGPRAVVASGAGTDHLAPTPELTIAQVIAAYEHQVEAIEGLGGRIILMASRALAACAKGPDDYARVYDHLLGQVAEPVIIHWLGDMFDPALAGYWGHRDPDAAMEVAIDVLNRHADRIDGVKISLLDKDKEIVMRRRLAPGIRMYTGDDFNFAELIAGDEHGYSDALLGIFDAIAPVASAALSALGQGDEAAFHRLLEPTVPLSRHIFCAPTRFYKTGVVFMAWLNGHQDHFVMVGGQQSGRHLVHLAQIARLADAAGLIVDADLATQRLQALLVQHGVGAQRLHATPGGRVVA